LQDLDVDSLRALVILPDVHHLRELEAELVAEPHVAELLLRDARLLHVVEMDEEVLPVVVHHDEPIVLVLVEELESACVALGGLLDDNRLLLRLVLLAW